MPAFGIEDFEGRLFVGMLYVPSGKNGTTVRDLLGAGAVPVLESTWAYRAPECWDAPRWPSDVWTVLRTCGRISPR